MKADEIFFSLMTLPISLFVACSAVNIFKFNHKGTPGANKIFSAA
jgi:hypothetical protein